MKSRAMVARARWGIAFALVALLAAACGGDGAVEEPEAEVEAGAETTVGVSMEEFKVTPEESTAAAGTVTFSVSNEGEQPHIFSVLRTDLAADELPTLPAGNADVTAQGITVIGVLAEISPGASEELTVDLEAGSYVLICNIVNHYSLGMNAALEVA